MDNNSERDSTLHYRDFQPNDTPTRFNRPGAKAAINLMAFAVLCLNFNHITGGFFTSVLMFCFPTMLDWLSFSPEHKGRKIIKVIELIILGIVFSISILGLIGAFEISRVDGNPHIMVSMDYAFFPGAAFPARVVMVLLAVSIIVTVADWFVVRTKAEDKIGIGVAATAPRQK